MSDLKRYEQETHIMFNAAEMSAEVCTSDPVIMRKMDKFCSEHPETYTLKYENEQFKGYVVSNKKLFYPHKPRTGRELTDEERVALSERLKAAREKRTEE